MKRIFGILLTLSVIHFSTAQISPPGLGKAHSASWFAFGIRQELDTTKGKGWQSVSYVGMGRKSNPNNINLFFKPAILVINQEFYHQFHSNWQYSMALSYRRQDEYLDSEPYTHDRTRIQQEFRLYGRLSYLLKTPRLKFVPTIRQEFRKYFTPDFKNPAETFQARSRFRLQLSVNLDKKKIHRLIFSSEFLFATSQKMNVAKWTNFAYKESRFSLYYSYDPLSIPFIFSFGYMHNLVGVKNPFSVHYLAIDVVLENPFKLKKRDKRSVIENYE